MPAGKADPDAPEVIIRKTCTFFEKRGKTYPVPELLVLANRAGFLWLSKVFASCARKTGETQPPFGDPDDHEHLDDYNPEINAVLSDEFALRLGILTKANRRGVIEKYELSRNKSAKGDLISQYERQIAEVRPVWRRLRAWERQAKKDEKAGKHDAAAAALMSKHAAPVAPKMAPKKKPRSS